MNRINLNEGLFDDLVAVDNIDKELDDVYDNDDVTYNIGYNYDDVQDNVDIDNEDDVKITDDRNNFYYKGVMVPVDYINTYLFADFKKTPEYLKYKKGKSYALKDYNSDEYKTFVQMAIDYINSDSVSDQYVSEFLETNFERIVKRYIYFEYVRQLHIRNSLNTNYSIAPKDEATEIIDYVADLINHGAAVYIWDSDQKPQTFNWDRIEIDPAKLKRIKRMYGGSELENIKIYVGQLLGHLYGEDFDMAN